MTMRSVQDRFWSDGWVRKLNPLDRYLFLYLITNEHTNWAGIYELEIGMMAFESGLDVRDLETSFLPRLSPKIIYVDGWVYVPNWVRHHASESGTLSPQQKEGMRKAMEKVPEYIRAKIAEVEKTGIPYGYPMDTVSPSSLSFASSSAYIPALEDEAGLTEELEVVKDSDLPGGVLGTSKSPSISGDKKKAYDELIRWSEKERGFPFPKTTRTKQYAAFRLANENQIPREYLMERWEEMSGKKFWQENGWDWMNVVQDLLKKPIV